MAATCGQASNQLALGLDGGTLFHGGVGLEGFIHWLVELAVGDAVGLASDSLSIDLTVHLAVDLAIGLTIGLRCDLVSSLVTC